jgi:CheY-like chemotaxis protein
MSKVMLVEDDNNLREIYEARLQAEGYAIVTAKDGEEALVVAKAEKPDLVISDVMMPKISGFEMLDILRNTDGLGAIKVIMLTALGQSEDQQRADKLGADRYLVKSQVTLEDIVKAAHELLGGDDAAAAAAPAPAPETDAAPAETAPAEPVAEAPAEPVAIEPAPVTPPVAEPVVSAPAAEPVTPVEPVAVAAEPSTDAVASTADDTADTTADEQASVEAKIEDFVSGATSVPTEPLSVDVAAATSSDAPAEPVAAPEPVSAVPAPDNLAALVSSDPEPTEETAPAEPVADAPAEPATDAAAATTAADDKLITDAVNTLVADAEKQAAPAATSDAPAPAPAEPVAEAPAPAPADDIDSKKIISPLDSAPKKDIHQLAAEEEAKEAAAKGQPAPATPPASGDDPNSIAL